VSPRIVFINLIPSLTIHTTPQKIIVGVLALNLALSTRKIRMTTFLCSGQLQFP